MFILEIVFLLVIKNANGWPDDPCFQINSTDSSSFAFDIIKVPGSTSWVIPVGGNVSITCKRQTGSGYSGQFTVNLDINATVYSSKNCYSHGVDVTLCQFTHLKPGTKKTIVFRCTTQNDDTSACYGRDGRFTVDFEDKPAQPEFAAQQCDLNKTQQNRTVLVCNLKPSIDYQRNVTKLNAQKIGPMRFNYSIRHNITGNWTTESCADDKYVYTLPSSINLTTTISMEVFAKTHFYQVSSGNQTFQLYERAQLSPVDSVKPVTNNTKSTRICVQWWNSPNLFDQDGPIDVQIELENEKTSNLVVKQAHVFTDLPAATSSICVDNLVPHTLYHVCVSVRPVGSQAWSKRGRGEATTNILTSADRPFSAVTLLPGYYINSTVNQCSSSTMCTNIEGSEPGNCTNITVYWQSLPESNYNGDDFGYLLVYEINNQTHDLELPSATTSWTLQFNIDSTVKINIQAKNKQGRGPLSTQQVLVTQDAGLIVQDLQIYSNDSTTVYVQCQITANLTDQEANFSAVVFTCHKSSYFSRKQCTGPLSHHVVDPDTIQLVNNMLSFYTSVTPTAQRRRRSGGQVVTDLVGVSISWSQGSTGILIPDFLYSPASAVVEISPILESPGRYHWNLLCMDVCAPALYYHINLTMLGSVPGPSEVVHVSHPFINAEHLPVKPGVKYSMKIQAVPAAGSWSKPVELIQVIKPRIPGQRKALSSWQIALIILAALVLLVFSLLGIMFIYRKCIKAKKWLKTGVPITVPTSEHLTSVSSERGLLDSNQTCTTPLTSYRTNSAPYSTVTTSDPDLQAMEPLLHNNNYDQMHSDIPDSLQSSSPPPTLQSYQQVRFGQSPETSLRGLPGHDVSTQGLLDHEVSPKGLPGPVEHSLYQGDKDDKVDKDGEVLMKLPCENSDYSSARYTHPGKNQLNITASLRGPGKKSQNTADSPRCPGKNQQNTADSPAYPDGSVSAPNTGAPSQDLARQQVMPDKNISLEPTDYRVVSPYRTLRNSSSSSYSSVSDLDSALQINPWSSSGPSLSSSLFSDFNIGSGQSVPIEHFTDFVFSPGLNGALPATTGKIVVPPFTVLNNFSISSTTSHGSAAIPAGGTVLSLPGAGLITAAHIGMVSDRALTTTPTGPYVGTGVNDVSTGATSLPSNQPLAISSTQLVTPSLAAYVPATKANFSQSTVSPQYTVSPTATAAASSTIPQYITPTTGTAAVSAVPQCIASTTTATDSTVPQVIASTTDNNVLAATAIPCTGPIPTLSTHSSTGTSAPVTQVAGSSTCVSSFGQCTQSTPGYVTAPQVKVSSDSRRDGGHQAYDQGHKSHDMNLDNGIQSNDLTTTKTYSCPNGKPQIYISLDDVKLPADDCVYDGSVETDLDSEQMSGSQSVKACSQPTSKTAGHGYLSTEQALGLGGIM